MQYLKILIVIPHLKSGGTERTASLLANYIAERGGDATLLMMFKSEHFYDLCTKVKVIEPAYTKRKLGRYFYFLYLIFFLRSHFKRQNPELIFALGYVSITLFSSLGLPAHVVMSLRSSPGRTRFPNNRVLNTSYKILNKLLKGRVDGIIAQTNEAAKFYNISYNCPIVIIPNFLRVIKEYKSTKQNQIINVGHCSFEKGQHFLIQAFSQLNAPGWKLVIIGDGPRRHDLEKLAEDLKIRERVVFEGYQKDVDLYLSRSRIFALTSVIEGYPNALIEAMATPLPAVSFNCVAGPSDIITDGVNGFLVEVGDVETFSNRLQLLIDHPELREMIQANAIKVREENHLDKIVPRYLDFFHQISID